MQRVRLEELVHERSPRTMLERVCRPLAGLNRRARAGPASESRVAAPPEGTERVSV